MSDDFGRKIGMPGGRKPTSGTEKAAWAMVWIIVAGLFVAATVGIVALIAAMIRWLL